MKISYSGPGTGFLDGRYIRKAPDADDNKISATTIDKSALILQTTDDDPTNGLLSALDSTGAERLTLLIKQANGSSTDRNVLRINQEGRSAGLVVERTDSAAGALTAGGNVGFLFDEDAEFAISSNTHANVIIGQADQDNVRMRMDGSGNVLFATGNLSIDTAQQFEIRLTDASQIGLVVQGASSQTANLTEWQDSSGNALGHITGGVGADMMTIGDKANTGGANGITFKNPATSGNSRAVINIQVGAGSTGDTYITFTDTPVTAFNWAIGVDNGDSDQFKISNSNVLGTADALQITTGELVGINGAPSARFQVTGSSDIVQTIIKANATQTNAVVEIQDSGGSAVANFDELGFLGIGRSPNPLYAINVTHNENDPTDDIAGIRVVTNLKTTTDTALDNVAMLFVAQTNNDADNYTGTVAGVSGNVSHRGTATLTTAIGLRSFINVSDTGTVTNAYGLRVLGASNSSGTIGTLYGIQVQDQNKGTANFAIQTGTGLNEFGDQLSVIGSQDIVQTIIKAHSTQTNNLVEWQNSSGTVLSAIQGRGTFYSDLGSGTSSHLFIGNDAGNASAGANNLMIGTGVGDSLEATAIDNVGIGMSSLGNITTGNRNMSLGVNALRDLTTGDDNIGIGSQANANVESGIKNTAVGTQSDVYNETGNNNTAVGYKALRGVSGQSHASNTGIGSSAGEGITTGGDNVFIGLNAGAAVTTHGANVIVGGNAGIGLAGANNVIVGRQAGGTATSGDRNIFLGYRAGYRQSTPSQMLVIDNRIRTDLATEATSAILYGVMDATTANQTLRINAALHLPEITTPTAIVNYGSIYPKTDNNLYFQDGAGVEKTLHDSEDTITIDLSLETYDAEPARSSETNLHGGFLSLATAQPLDSVPTDLVVTKGIGKVMIVVNAGSDLAGDITVTGESIDRDTGASTLADTDTITVDATTTDGSDTDSNGNIRHSFTGAYITSKWFTGTVTLSTADLTLTDVDVYHVSFEQFNDSPNITLNTFDANLFTTNTSAEFDAYLYCLEATGDKCDISRCSSLNVGADGETAIANKYWRLRRGGLAQALDGTTDGVWVDVHYSNSPAYIEDVNIKVWASKVISMTIV